MAERRMFTQKIINSDAFLEMPCSAQALYFHLGMRADDDGVVNNPQTVARTCNASTDDLKLLLAKRFILPLDGGLIVIKHWRMHNLLRKDRYNPTQYQLQLSVLTLKGDGSYTEKTGEIEGEKEPEKPPDNQTATKWQPNGNQVAPQDSIGKYSIGKNSIAVSSIVYNANSGCSPDDDTANAAANTQELYCIDGVGQNVVWLTKAQYDDLLARLGYDNLVKYIERVATYIVKTNARIASHYDTILKWYTEDSKRPSGTISVGVKFSNIDAEDVFEQALARTYAGMEEE